MRHLIVVAHPAETSFTLALAGAYAAELAALGETRQIHDLYRMGFDPVLRPGELEAPDAGHPPAADVARAQDDVRAAEVLTVVYPLWWLSMPAILKGYVDRVFARGFAYEAENGKVRGLLGGRKCVLVTLSGAPLSALAAGGRWSAALTLQDVHIFQATGFELVEHLHFDGIAPGMPGSAAETHLARIRQCARTHFAGG